MLHISLAAETIFHIGPLAVTNTLLMSWLAILVIVVAVYFGTRKNNIIPSGFQNFFESIIEGLYNLIHSITENRKQATQFMPLIATFIIYITVANWMGLIPGVGTIGLYEEAEEGHAEVIEEVADENLLASADEAFAASEKEDGEEVHGEEAHTTFVPLFRSVNSDINMTLAISLISVIFTQFIGIAAIGFVKHAKKFINFSSPINFFVGVLELIGEVAHLVSFSFRLFGNVFAGEVLLVVIAFLVPYVAPVPFYFLEIFVGFIQALVFALLTLVFFKTATIDHAEEAH